MITTSIVIASAKRKAAGPLSLSVVSENIPDPKGEEVLLELEAIPIHLSDVYALEGTLKFFNPKPPYTPGLGGLARVAAKGPDVEGFDIGQRVYLPFTLQGQGAWRQHVVLPSSSLRKAPEGDACQLCLIPSNGLTAYALLNCVTVLGAGDWLIQNAANSNVGRFVIALAKRSGIRTINIVRRMDVVADLKALGADIVLLESDDIAAAVKAAVGDSGKVQLGIDAIAGEETQRIVDAVSHGGTVVTFGMLSQLPLMVHPESLFLRAITVKGFFTHHATACMSKSQIELALNELFELAADNTIDSKIAGTYSLRDIDVAVEHAKRTGASRDGKILLLPNHH